MSVPHTLLGLLEPKPAHGYSLKQSYDARFGRPRGIHIGQVYSTLARLQRDGLAAVVSIEPGTGPDRKTYAITEAGVSELDTWLRAPEPATVHAHDALVVKVTLALLGGRPAEEVLDAQRTVHLARMRELTAARRTLPVLERVAADYEIAHLDADLRWVEETGARLSQVRSELGR